MSKLITDNRSPDQSRDFAEGIIDSLRDPLIILDMKFNVVAANSAFFEKFVSTPDETQNRNLFDLSNRSWDLPELRTLLEATAQRSKSFRDLVIDGEFAGLGHKTLLLNGRRVCEQGEETEKILLVIEDITLRRLQEKAMRFQAEALNRVNDAVIAIDKKGCLTYWNSRAEALLKIPPDAPDKIRLEDICTRIESDSSGLFAVSTQDRPWREYRVRLADSDEEYYLESSATTSVAPDGSLDGKLVVLRDVTARTKAEARLKRTNSELELFTSVASHDLQEPLRTVTLYLEMLAKSCKGKLEPSADEYIALAVGGTKRMKALLDHLLLYARFQAGGEKFKRVSLARVVTNVVHDLKLSIDENHASVQVSELPEVIAEEGQMRQVFQNLILNAIKHGARDRRPVIKIAAEKKSTEWVISVKDNGEGFDMAHAEKIFQLFLRLGALTDSSGMGLGLTITKKIVEAHDGRIWAESERGAGSTFYFTLPS